MGGVRRDPATNEAIDQGLAESVQTFTANVDRSKDLFLGVLGHDLRTPLAAVMMSATTTVTEEGATRVSTVSQAKPIEVTLREDHETAVVAIHDKGPRIAAQHLNHIFDPFRRFGPHETPDRTLGSVGLGLYITKAIVSAHRGTIDVASTEDGTTFTVRLPFSAPPPAITGAGIASSRDDGTNADAEMPSPGDHR